MLVLLPAVQITFYCATVGNDVKDVKLLFTNNDTSKIYPLLSSRAALILVLVLGRYCCFMKYQIDHYIAVDTTAHARIKQHPFVLVYFGYLKVSIIIAPLFDYCLNINFLTFVSLLYYMTSELTWYTTSKERMAPITLIIKSNKQLHYCNVHSHSVSFSALLQPIYNEEQYEKHLCNQSSHHRNYDLTHAYQLLRSEVAILVCSQVYSTHYTALQMNNSEAYSYIQKLRIILKTVSCIDTTAHFHESIPIISSRKIGLR